MSALVDLERLPHLRTHTTAHQVSSHDPTGGNDDGFFSVNFQYFDRTRNEFVLLEETGAGCVYRIQMSDLGSFFGGPVRFRVYIDGAPAPQIDTLIQDLYNGNTPGFKAPLVGRSHEGFGYYSYVPIPYRTSIRIALVGLVRFYNIGYHKYRPASGTRRPGGATARSMTRSTCGSAPETGPPRTER